MTATVYDARVRVGAWDAFRGLAVCFMVIDHVALTTGLPDELRILPGRLAMPMFFLLAGYLARTPRWRHLVIGAVGLALPLLVRWIDHPNVLVLWAVGVGVLWLWREAGLPAWILAAVGLGMAANGYVAADGSYDVVAMWGLMALGGMLPGSAFGWAGRLPAAFVLIGRHPIVWYLGHLAVLELATGAR